MTKPLFLIVDDERNFREFLGEALQGEGYEVVHAGTARAGLAMARQSLPRVILLDQNLPDQSGLELLPELRRLPVCPVIIVITAHAQFDYAVDAVKAGAFHYLPKPFAFSDLLDVLAKATITAAERPGVVQASSALHAMIGACPGMVDLKQQVVRVARSPVSAILVQGESGTGKELVAQAIHAESTRSAQRIVAVNCAALTDTLLMSELFGHERGAFTDARQQRRGVFELAQGGTLFLDEVSEMGARAQAALLRTLEQRRVVRVGGSDEIVIDVRVVAATNRDLGRQVTSGQFRADLYHRLNVVRLDLPPLRDRGHDIELLAEHLSRVVAERYAEPQRPFSSEVRGLLMSYTWPGNVRELRNGIERAYAMTGGTSITSAALPAEWGANPFMSAGTPTTGIAAAGSVAGFQDAKRDVVVHFEQAFLRTALANAGGNVTLAAERAGVLRQVFQRMLLRHGIAHEEFRDPTTTRSRRDK
ncbi:MAG: sigma-54 dependent transcriptional regulator [bacterium]